ncbi:hypothetical protein BJ741DRAFT_589436 [Chytriomyces cf. hyalinus JEL632]|nr:hypothetical protein BJ741DRAFT_589436 [Chytriomyces cf. hyalinus JEL632]
MSTPLLSDPQPMGVSNGLTGSISTAPASNAPTAAAAAPQESIFTKSAHPTVLFFHLLFRSLAIIFYMFGWIFTTNFVTSFVVIILLLSFDFWTVKNVTGRLLVGLRWWNEIREDGENVWIFESREGRPINQTDSSVFWFALYAAPAIWFLFGLGAVIRFSFQWTLCVVVALILNMANVVGYSRCHKDSQSRVNSFMQNQGFMQGMVTTMVGNSIGNFFSGSGGGATAPARV